MVLPFKTMDYDNDRFDTLNDVSLNNLSINDLINMMEIILQMSLV